MSDHPFFTYLSKFCHRIPNQVLVKELSLLAKENEDFRDLLEILDLLVLSGYNLRSLVEVIPLHSIDETIKFFRERSRKILFSILQQFGYRMTSYI